MIFQNLFGYLTETLLQRVFIFNVQPEYGRVAVSVSLCILNGKLGLTDSSKAVKNRDPTATVAA
jgi:hypothetical protein